MPNTTVLGISYPSGLPGVAPDPAGDMHSLASTTETGVLNRYDAARTETTDTGWSLTPLTLQSGWSTKTDPLGNASGTLKGGIRRIGQRVEMRVRATRSGATLTSSSASGNISPDVPVFILASGWFPASNTYDDFIIPGIAGGIFRVQSDGTIAITNFFNNNTTISNGDIIQLNHEWFLN